MNNQNEISYFVCFACNRTISVLEGDFNKCLCYDCLKDETDQFYRFEEYHDSLEREMMYEE